MLNANSLFSTPLGDYSAFLQTLRGSPLQKWLESLPQQLTQALQKERHGHYGQWQEILHNLPLVQDVAVDLQASAISAGTGNELAGGQRKTLEASLQSLHPWRKGPYDIHGIYIDSEWRSDWKWQRLCRHIASLQDRLVLDVGCGNGYHCWRMRGAGARQVIGIDPTLLNVVQFRAIQHFLGHKPEVTVLPLGIEDVPPNLRAFDTVFSMGVFYHRRSPFDHLLELRTCLRPGGQLVLETLVIEGDEGEVLVPVGRYAKMRNVWFIPTCSTLQTWLERCAYHDIRLLDVTPTSTEEQRRTEWMRFESLADFLNPADSRFTVENLPAPRRAIFTAIAK